MGCFGSKPTEKEVKENKAPAVAASTAFEIPIETDRPAKPKPQLSNKETVDQDLTSKMNKAEQNKQKLIEQKKQQAQERERKMQQARERKNSMTQVE